MMVEKIKILNNNAVVCRDNNHEEFIVMGKGIAFCEDIETLIDNDPSVKVFRMAHRDLKTKFEQLLMEIPLELIAVSEKIIDLAKTKLEKNLNDSIYIALGDHLNSCIERKLNGIELRNPLLWDIKRLYDAEFKLGKEALNIIKDDLHVELNEDEAASIALHIVNAELNEELPVVIKMTQIIPEVLNIVKYHFKMKLDEESLNYYRFITHLKFFAQRLLNDTHQNNMDNEIFDLVRKKHQEAFKCADKISKFISKKYNYDLNAEEMTYLTVHIARIVNRIN
ncbi:PRD domain-containing protein [Shouchella clausii]